MSEAMHRLNVTILEGGNKFTHWTGSPSAEGGALVGIDCSPVGGPPVFDYDTTGNMREQRKFTLDTKIPGTTEDARTAFVAKYANGTVFTNQKISGLPGTNNWIVENALPKHSADGNTPSTLTITLAEVGSNTGEEEGSAGS